MPLFLRNKILQVEIGVPGEFYTGSRFDYSGNIRQITYKNHTFCTTEKNNYSPVFGFGLLNEFDIESPAGYSEAKPKELFLKIGVGSLQKEDEQPYSFQLDYKNQPLAFEMITTGETALEYKSKSPLVAGYQMQYTKELAILKNKLIISYFLKNTGGKSFETEEYCHNFLAIDQQKIGPDYGLNFDFNLQPDQFSELVNPAETLSVARKQIGWNKIPSDDFFISTLNGNERIQASWKLVNNRMKAGVCEHTDFISHKINLWGNNHVVSPELFFRVHLSPGEEARWQRIFTFFET
ncbi:MAG TPA: hypothetical protein PKH79_02085 [Prolixibacteraceae bacterium]|nr:hypothetical protein [Prolixibacteraceae bacterium]HPS12994.1 hypothetical protein [Prolixibacteraceae bacterium]